MQETLEVKADWGKKEEKKENYIRWTTQGRIRFCAVISQLTLGSKAGSNPKYDHIKDGILQCD